MQQLFEDEPDRQAAYIQVALPIPAQKLFTYKLPPAYANISTLGFRVLVPFGKQSLTGIVVQEGAITDIEADKIRPVIEVLDDKPSFSEVLLQLTRWVAEYYMCSWGEALKAALPQGLTPKSTRSVVLKHRPTADELATIERRAPRKAALLRELIRHEGEYALHTLEQRLKSDHLLPHIEALVAEGWIESLNALTSTATVKTARAAAIHPDLLADIPAFRAILDELERKAPKQATLLSSLFIQHQRSPQPILLNELMKRLDISQSAWQSLVTKNLVVEHSVEIRRDRTMLEGFESLAQRNEAEVALSIEQAHAVSVINTSITEGGFKPFLLHGVTGSGKTIVYMKIIATAITLGKTALLLVPEIALTPQLIDRFEAVFPGKITVFHSKMSVGERYDAWRAARDGKVQILIGARSALFAPLSNIGLIIIDEEHEPSYKQDDPAPRYHARDTALVRASLEKAVIVLGSATPSLESMFNAHAGKYHLLEITARADGAQLPEIDIIDMRSARKKGAYYGPFSLELLSAIRTALHKREGIIIFQNRRGYASFLECNDCSFIPTCPNCSVSLTLHKAIRLLRCHYCGFSHQAVSVCPNCGGDDMEETGTGTQRIEETLREYLQGIGVQATIERLDLDTTSRKNSLREILSRFSSGEIDVLIGTQMVTKGIDFSRVTLVGVINADGMLYLPDFRAAERTYQLLTQVAGRAGRSGDKKGQVFIQTSTPDHPVILSTKIGRFEMFYNDELQHRRLALYPPFSRFIIVQCSGKHRDEVLHHIRHFSTAFPAQHPAFEVIGPAPATIEKLRGEYRQILLIKSRKEYDISGKITRQAIIHALTEYHRSHGSSSVKMIVDIDSGGGM